MRARTGQTARLRSYMRSPVGMGYRRCKSETEDLRAKYARVLGAHLPRVPKLPRLRWLPLTHRMNYVLAE